MLVIIRGGGDLASGVAVRLVRSGLRVAITELAQPLAVRRSVSFAEAIYTGETTIEGLTGQRVTDASDSLRILSIFARQRLPVIVDPGCLSARALFPSVIVDARMTKRPPEPIGYVPQVYIGLGPGFVAGQNCQAAVETRRGSMLGRVFWQGGPQSDTGQPDGDPARVLRAPASGEIVTQAAIGEHVEAGQPIAEVNGQTIQAPFAGVVRGLIKSGLVVSQGMKIGDIDPRDDPALCQIVSDKALAIGGGVLEAILSKPELRLKFWA